MKKVLRTAVFLFIGMVIVSCSETGQVNSAVIDESSSHVTFVEEIKMYMRGMNISLPDMAYTMGRVSIPTSANLQSGGLSLDWANAHYTETGNLEILTIPVEMKESVTVARYYKENRKPGKTILTSLYPYLSVRKEKNTGVLSSRLISYAPDVRFLRNHKLDFKNFLESQPLTKDYSGLYLISEIDGKLLSGLLHYCGELKYRFTFNSGRTKCCDQDSIIDSDRILSIGFNPTDPTIDEGMCNCNADNESGSMDSYCDGCKQFKDQCKCCFPGRDVCDRCGENPCVMCLRCVKCGNYEDECTCKCSSCDHDPCTCPKCKSCDQKYEECVCINSDVCRSNGCECFRCR